MVCTVAIPWLTGRAVDPSDAGTTTATRSSLFAVAIVGAASCGSASRSRGGWSPGSVSLGVEYDLRNGLYAHLQALELGFFDRQQTGPADVARDRRPAVGALLPRLRAGVHRSSRADDPARRRGDVRAQTRGWRRSRWCPVPFVVLVAARYGRRSRPALQEVQQRIAELTAEVEENVSGVRVVKAFARRGAPARALPRAACARVFDQSMYRDAAAGVLQPVHRLPAATSAWR